MGYREIDPSFGYYPDGDDRLHKGKLRIVPQLSDHTAIESSFWQIVDAVTQRWWLITRHGFTKSFGCYPDLYTALSVRVLTGTGNWTPMVTAFRCYNNVIAIVIYLNATSGWNRHRRRPRCCNHYIDPFYSVNICLELWELDLRTSSLSSSITFSSTVAGFLLPARLRTKVARADHNGAR